MTIFWKQTLTYLRSDISYVIRIDGEEYRY